MCAAIAANHARCFLVFFFGDSVTMNATDLTSHDRRLRVPETQEIISRCADPESAHEIIHILTSK